MSAYYNEHDLPTAAWLRELIREGLIADGEVDTRSIVDVRPADLRGFVQCHFFAGIGGWSYALRLAGAFVMLLVSGATVTVRRWKQVGELIVPGAGSAPDSLKLVPGQWAMDNGCYSGFDAAMFVRMLERFHGRKGCRFVSAPDVVADAHDTLQQWPFWSRLIRGVGFVPALVAQDGLTVPDVPWGELGTLFIGGTTEWKLGPQARDLMAYAKTRGLWVHVGRLNSRKRIWHFGRLADSFDGGQYSMFADRRIPEGVADAASAVAQRALGL